MSDTTTSAIPPALPTEGSPTNSARIVARNTGAGLGASVALKVLGLVFNVYVVRRLGAAHFGQYSAILAYVGLFSVFSDLGVVSYATREMAENRDRTQELVPDLVAIRILLSLLIIVAAPLSAWWLGKEHNTVIGILVASVSLIVYGVQGPLGSALAARERIDSLAVFSVVHQLVFWASAIVLLLSGAGFMGLILASLLGITVETALTARLALRMHSLKSARPSSKRWLDLFRRSLPFGISAVAFSFIGRFSVAYMSFSLPDTQIGFYSAAYNIINIIMFLPQNFAIALYPTLVREVSSRTLAGERMIKWSTKYLLIISIPLVMGGIITSDRLITLLYGAEFQGAILVFKILLVSLPILFLLEVFGRVSSVFHMEKQAAKINVASAIVTVLCCVWLVPTLGIVGGAVALFASVALRLVGYWWLIGTQRMVDKWAPLLRMFAAAGIMGLAVWALRSASLPVAVGAGAALYAALILLFRVVEVRELARLRAVLFRQAAS